MNILLTPTLMRFLADEGYTHYLSKNNRSEEAFILLMPIRAHNNLTQPEEGFDSMLTASQISRVADNLNNRQIAISLDIEILIKYTDELMKTVDRRNEVQA